MANRRQEAQPSRASLREEAQKLLDEATQLTDRERRRPMLLRAFELVQLAETLPGAPATPPALPPKPDNPEPVTG